MLRFPRQFADTCMLEHLKISNYALIKEVDLDFRKGLTAITGETGSGKSILLGAFGLLLGERAESRSIRDESVKCVVEAIFDLSGYRLEEFFESHDLDFDPKTTIRREIAPGGKSRAFINDTPVQLSTLKTLGTMLVDVHSQHENSLLASRDFQFQTVDAFAKNDSLMSEYQQIFNRYKTNTKELDELIKNQDQIRKEMDFIRFQLAEFEKAGLSELNVPDLEQELETLNNAEQIKTILSDAVTLIESDNAGILQQLSNIKTSLGKISGFNSELHGFYQRLESCSIELRELAREIEHYESSVGMDHKRADALNDKLSQVYQLQRKHRVQTSEELMAIQKELESKAGNYTGFDDTVEKLEKVIRESEIQLNDITSKLTEARKAAAAAAEKEVQRYFKALHLDHARLSVEITPAKTFNQYGLDEISFLFSANKGSKLQPVKQVASGGEISRVMLAMKAAISKYKKLPVLILDEIDQGVSGEAGRKIGMVLREMSDEMQLLTITHLPQIAGQAGTHLKVYKFVQNNETHTGVQLLSGEDRIRELAEMLSGKEFSKAAMDNARELLVG